MLVCSLNANFCLKLKPCRAFGCYGGVFQFPLMGCLAVTETMKYAPAMHEGANLFFFSGFVNGKNDILQSATGCLRQDTFGYA
jgi:hypothetical protein